MEIIKPFNDKNAVKIIAFAFAFSKRLTLEEMDILIENINKNNYLKEEFPKRDKQQEISMTIGPDGIPKPSQSLGGLICSKIENSKNAWILEINKDLLIITCSNYTRWKNIAETSFKYIDEIFGMIPGSDSRIANIALEYLDEFIVNSSQNWKESLFKNSEYLPQHVYSVNDYWHINHGFFFNIPNIEEKTLNTIATNFFADEMDGMQEKINIRMQHKVIYNSAIPYNKSKIIETFNYLHIYSKEEIFEKIINDSVLETFERGDQ